MTDHDYESTGGEFDKQFTEVHERIDALAESGGGGDSGDVLQQLAAALEPYLDTGGDVPDDITASLDSLREGVEEHSVSIAEVENRLDTIEGAVAALEEEGVGGRSDEEVRQLIREYVDNNVETGGLTQEEVETIVTSSLADLDIQGFDEEVIERVRYHTEALDFPARKVGPSEPIGGYHGVDMWGLKFYTGRECYIHSAVVDAAESGSTTVVLGETDGGDQFDEVDSTEITVDEGVQRVDLDLEVPDEGYWLLARKGDLPLRRGEWSGWQDYMVDNLRFRAGDKPGYSENNYWYYFFDLEMTANKTHEFPD